MKTTFVAAIGAAMLFCGQATAYPMWYETLNYDDSFGKGSYAAYLAARMKADPTFKYGTDDFYYWIAFQNRFITKDKDMKSLAGGDETQPATFKNDMGSRLNVGAGTMDVYFLPALHGAADLGKSIVSVPLVTAACGVDYTTKGEALTDNICFILGAPPQDFAINLFKGTSSDDSELYVLNFTYTEAQVSHWDKILAVVSKVLAGPKAVGAFAADTPVGMGIASASAAVDVASAVNDAAEPGRLSSDKRTFYLSPKGTLNEKASTHASGVRIIKTLKKNAPGHSQDASVGDFLVYISRHTSMILDATKQAELSSFDILTSDVRVAKDNFAGKIADLAKQAPDFGPGSTPQPIGTLEPSGTPKTKINPYQQLYDLCGTITLTAKQNGYSNLDADLVRRSYLIYAGYDTILTSQVDKIVEAEKSFRPKLTVEAVQKRCWSQPDETLVNETAGKMHKKLVDTFGTYTQ